MGIVFLLTFIEKFQNVQFHLLLKKIDGVKLKLRRRKNKFKEKLEGSMILNKSFREEAKGGVKVKFYRPQMNFFNSQRGQQLLLSPTSTSQSHPFFFFLLFFFHTQNLTLELFLPFLHFSIFLFLSQSLYYNGC